MNKPTRKTAFMISRCTGADKEKIAMVAGMLDRTPAALARNCTLGFCNSFLQQRSA
jgi:hypothetical protein